jgi:predicted amidohydrolase
VSLTKTLTVGSFQFAAGSDVSVNLEAIERGMRRASDRGVRLLLTQECSLCGYPPLERDTAASVDLRAQLEALERVSSLAQTHGLFVVLGLITSRGSSFLNSLCLVRPDGAPEPMYHKRALWAGTWRATRPAKRATSMTWTVSASACASATKRASMSTSGSSPASR